MLNSAFDTNHYQGCHIPNNPIYKWDVDLIDGQLLPHGASYNLILAIADGHELRIREVLLLESDLEKRQRLSRIIQRLAPILGRNR